MIRRCPNGATRMVEDHAAERLRTQGTETSKYLEEEKIIMIPQVVASERGKAQTHELLFMGPSLFFSGM